MVKTLSSSRFFFALSGFATFFALCVVVLGAFTRLTDSGLGCPDWPGCYGHLTVPTHIDNPTYASTPLVAAKAWTEMAHRYIASTLGALIVLITVIAVLRRQKSPVSPTLPCLLLLLVTCQGLLGMWTVTLKLHPTIVMLHLLGGFTTLALLWSLFVQQWHVKTPLLSEQLRFRKWAILSLLVLSMQIILGGWTSANYAALICPDFPLCQGKFLPLMRFSEGFNFMQAIGPNFAGGALSHDARVAIHFSHRLGAVLTFVVLASSSLFVYLRSTSRLLKRCCLLIATLLCLQVTLGTLNVVKLLPLSIAVMHNAVAAVLLLAVLTFNLLLWQRPKD